MGEPHHVLRGQRVRRRPGDVALPGGGVRDWATRAKTRRGTTKAFEDLVLDRRTQNLTYAAEQPAQTPIAPEAAVCFSHGLIVSFYGCVRPPGKQTVCHHCYYHHCDVNVIFLILALNTEKLYILFASGWGQCNL